MPAARPLSICLVSDDFLPAATGVGIHVQRIGEGLVRRGHRMSLITTRRPGQAAREEWRGVQVHRTFTLKAFGFYQALPSRAFIARVFREHAVSSSIFTTWASSSSARSAWRGPSACRRSIPTT
jgi:hypothetical protein